MSVANFGNQSLSTEVLSSCDFCIKTDILNLPPLFFSFQVCKINWTVKSGIMNENLIRSWFVHKNVKMIHQYKLKKTKAKIERRNLKLFWTLQKKSNLYSSKFPSLAECEVKQKNALHIKSDKNIWSKISCSESCIATTLYDYFHLLDNATVQLPAC